LTQTLTHIPPNIQSTAGNEHQLVAHTPDTLYKTGSTTHIHPEHVNTQRKRIETTHQQNLSCITTAEVEQQNIT
jgi:hypothetical protein